MFHFNNKKTQRKIAAVIAVLLIIAMIVPTVLSVLGQYQTSHFNLFYNSQDMLYNQQIYIEFIYKSIKILVIFLLFKESKKESL